MISGVGLLFFLFFKADHKIGYLGKKAKNKIIL